MLVGGISDDFSSDPTSKTSPWILPNTESNWNTSTKDITINASGTIQSEALTRVNQISFKAKSATNGVETTLEVRYYKNKATGDFETLGIIKTSSNSYLTYTYTIEEFNDATVSSKTGVLKLAATNAAAVIDDFVAVAHH